MNARSTLAALVVLAGSIVLRAHTPTIQAAPAQTAPDLDKAKAVFVRLCSDCHDRDRVVAMRRTRTEWEDVLNQMIDKGAVGTEQDFEAVLAYLLKTVGRVFINTSSAADLVSVLGTSTADAEAIVAYRKEHGKFPDLDTLLKVPGIDAQLLQKEKDAIAF
jgi:competence protein ComEA